MRLRSKVLSLALATMAATTALAGATPAAACANPYVYLSLGGFPSEVGSARIFVAAEGAASTSFTVRRQSHDCSFDDATVRYAVRHVTSGSDDLDETSGRSAPLYDPEHDESRPSTQTVSVPLKNGTLVENAVEKAAVELSDPEGGVLGTPSTAPLYLIDDDGAARFAFAESAYTHDEKMGRLEIPVFRAGDASGTAAVSYEVTGGPAPSGSPEQDLSSPAEGTISFTAGQRVGMISLDLAQDGISEGTENLTVDLLGEAAAAPSSTAVSITDDARVPTPSTRFHHPLDGKRYPRKSYYLRDIHVFAKNAGAGVKAVHIALRRQSESGVCAWWTGNDFIRGQCSDQRWLKMSGGSRLDEDEFFYRYEMDPIRPTVGTSIRRYTVYARGTDRNGNTETDLERGRNHNSFKVTR